MKKTVYIWLLIIAFGAASFAQTGEWKTHLSYYNTTEVVETNSLIFAVANGALYSFNDREDNRIYQYSPYNGLSDTQVKTIGYSREHDLLVIVYTNGNIDLHAPGTGKTRNLPYLKQDLNIQDKAVNEIYFNGDFAYLSTQFGILALNLKKEEITDTYRLNTAIYSVCIKDNTIYASTGKGILSASTQVNLLDYNNWLPLALTVSPEDKEQISRICVFENLLTFFISGGSNTGVYYLQSDGAARQVIKDSALTGMTLQNGMLILLGDKRAVVMPSFTSSYTIANDPVYSISSTKDKNTFWLATGDNGIKGIRRNGDKFDILLSGTTINSPMHNYCAFMSYRENKLVIAGGGRWNERNNTPGTLMVHDGEGWFNFLRDDVRQVIPARYEDLTSAAIDPSDNMHYFASSWGEGLYEFRDNKAVMLHNSRNSALETIFPNNPATALNYIRIDGLCFDKEGNLWMTNSEVGNGIKILKADRSWATLPYLNKHKLIDKILITKEGHKWVNVLRESSLIFILDDGGTIGDTSDDRTREVSNFHHYANGQSSAILSNYFYCMAEDKNGSVWIGTDIGPLIIHTPANILNDPDAVASAYRPVRTDAEGLSGYLLDDEKVRAIAIDGGNRVWLGTEGNGVMVVKDDGSETYEHFTSANSPLPSDNIQSLAANPHTGEIFIGTDKGIVSYAGGATEGAESYSDVYAYPNPVRPEYQDIVTVTGLMDDSDVRITDINGNLIVRGKSLGGQFTWNCRNRNGQRVATGIYLVMAAQQNKGESVVTKIMVVK